MKPPAKVEKLEQEKEQLRKLLRELESKYYNDEITRKEFLDKKYELLEGKFVEEAFRDIDDEIEKLHSRKKTIMVTTAAILILAITIPLLNTGGLTGFATLTATNESIMTVNETFDGNATKTYEMNVTSLKATGKVYGYGETWIYLVQNGQRKLIHYADTRQSGITGQVTGVPANQSKGKSKNKTAPNQASQNANTTNSTSNTTINSTNTTQSATSNETIQTNNTTTNTTINNTGNETNQITNETSTNKTFKPNVNTDRSTYQVGDNVSINVTPKNSTYTLYMHTPRDTYILSEEWWITQVKGNHTASALITYLNETDRASTTFTVMQPLTQTFEESCIDTCNVPETQARIEIVTDGTILKLDSLTYTEDNATSQTSSATESSAQTIQQQPQQNKGQQTSKQKRCLLPNPNARPESCFTQEELNQRFPEKNIRLVNRYGQTMARFDGQGNMYIKGELIEEPTSQPDPQFDLVINGQGEPAAWIDGASGNLYLRGQLTENEETLMWKSKQDYVVNNRNGMYLGVFEANTGDLRIRGTLNEGGLG